MPWNPDVYNQFKNIRYQPFFDLMAMIAGEGLKNAVDIGCGTGEQTSILSEKFSETNFTGIDPSPEMLEKSRGYEHAKLHFKQKAVEDFIAEEPNQKWDLILSNAALQWSDNHSELFPKLISLLSNNGQLAVQMPVQNENLLNKLLVELVQEKPFVDYLKGWKRETPMLTIDAYAALMFDHGLKNIEIVQKVYPIIADTPDQLFDFIAGSALIPYIERLTQDEQKIFVAAYKNSIKKAYKKFPAIYAFKRLLLYGNKKC